jgi:glycosyltransferase involved in cell wall biosynthesis
MNKRLQELKDQPDHPDYKLVILGEGKDRNEILHIVKRLKLETSVILAGWQENVIPYLQNAVSLVHASRYEGWPNVLVEAMACGCPVISTDCKTGPAEILDNGKYGILVPVDDIEALSNAMTEIAENHEKRHYYKKLGKKRSEDFEASKIASRYIETIHQLAT